MNQVFHPLPPGFPTLGRRQSGRSRNASAGDFAQGSARRGVVQGVKATLETLPFSPMEDPSLDQSEQLISSVIIAFVQGDLKPGDPFPGSSELVCACHMNHHQVLAAITSLLSRRILQQDRSGTLRIHPRAAPTIEMKQQAFLVHARQLVGQARKWQLPSNCLDQLFTKANRGKE